MLCKSTISPTHSPALFTKISSLLSSARSLFVARWVSFRYLDPSQAHPVSKLMSSMISCMYLIASADFTSVRVPRAPQFGASWCAVWKPMNSGELRSIILAFKWWLRAAGTWWALYLTYLAPVTRATMIVGEEFHKKMKAQWKRLINILLDQCQTL